MNKNISESTDYPAKFCSHRWCENEKCAEKAESLIKGYRKFVTHVSTLRKNEQTDSKNKSVIVLKKMIHNFCKAQVFRNGVSQVECFPMRFPD